MQRNSFPSLGSFISIDEINPQPTLSTTIASKSFITTAWSGGTSTQLFIWPENAAYQQRDFVFRLSTATVETEQSDFTKLIGFSRKLMILEGSILVKHEGRYSKRLNKFEQDSFDGGWNTSSEGKCTDFNLMMSEKAGGELKTLSIEAEQTIPYQIQERCTFFFVFVNAGSIEILIDQKKEMLQKGDLFVLEKPNFERLLFSALAETDLIIVSIKTD